MSSPESSENHAGSQPASGALARWCTIQPDGECVLDGENISSQVSETDAKDSAFMRDVVHGRILNAKVYPLIFETADGSALDVVRLRSLAYFAELVAGLEAGYAAYSSLSLEQKKIIAVGVRDLFIADLHKLLDEREVDILKGMVELVDDGIDESQVMGMAVSFYPSANRTIVKFIEDLDAKIGHERTELFAQVMSTPKLFAVFVNPADLSYHNFENIVPLDSWFESKLAKEPGSSLGFDMADNKRVDASHEVFTCKLRGASDNSNLLKELSTLDLYVPPLNKGTRGGSRFIFHSTLLGQRLTEAVRSSDILSQLDGGQLSASFDSVNYVFRCNKFAPGDSKFSSHLDTPYYDGNNHTVSKYTLLIYLSSGKNDSVLRVKDVKIDEVEEMTCVIFDQRYEHEGRPFLEGHKIFLRTELIFKDHNLQHDDQISSLFSQACYMTGESLFDEDLALYANACFERANKLRWSVEKESPEPTVYRHKQFKHTDFITNGYNYWFSKKELMNVKDCAFFAVLDYFNCKVGPDSFRSLLKATTVREPFSNNDDIWKFLSAKAVPSRHGFTRLEDGHLKSMLKELEDGYDKSFARQLEDWDGDDEELEQFGEEGDGCCPMHSFPKFNPWLNVDIMKCYEKCCEYTREGLYGAPLLFLNQEIVINERCIKIDGDKIFILQDPKRTEVRRINFAACWSSDPGPPEFVVVGKEVPAPKLLLPPITFHECDQGYQLSLDFFRNDWMVKVDDEHTIPIPNVVENWDFDASFIETVPDPEGKLEKLHDYFANASDA